MERLIYPENHWARSEHSDSALEEYLSMYNNAYNQTKVRLIEGFLGELNGRKILDYGGGAGYMSVLCAEKGGDIALVDAEKNALSTARYYAKNKQVEDRIEFICSECYPKRLSERKFHIIIAKDILEHIENDDEFLRQLSSCQLIGDILVLSTQNSCSINYVLEGFYERVWHKKKDWYGWDPTHLRFYSPYTLKKKLSNAGYIPIKWRGAFIIPYNILSWLFLLKIKITIPALHFVDLSLGRYFPFNRLGWNIIVSARKEFEPVHRVC